jgi:threonine dehydrogenase-like Zn-dependent dehydrogenase
MEAHGHGIDWYSDRAKQMMGISFDRPFALRQCIQSCRKGGTVSVPGVYGGFLDNFPFGAAFGKGLTFKMGQTNMHKYMPKLLDHIQKGDIDPSVIITHRLSLQDAPDGYNTFLHKEENCIKVVLDPWEDRSLA